MRRFLSLLCLGFSVVSVAESYITPAEVLQMQINQLNSFSASFAQATYEQDEFLLDEQKGEIYFSQPGRLRWEAQEPFAQTLVADGTNIYLHDPDLNQVTIRAWDSDPMQNPAAIFVSNEELSSYFSVEHGQDKGSFVLTPITEGASILQLKLSFDGDLPKHMEIEDSLGQRTLIEFSDQKGGLSLEPSVFVFTVPEGAEVIIDG